MTGATTILTKRSATIWIVAGLLVGLTLAVALASYQGARADGHATGTESIALSKTELNFVPGTRNSRENVWIRGSGFQPGTEIRLVYQEAVSGAFYDISFAGANISVSPIIANDDGAFAANWRLGRLTRSAAQGDVLVTLYATEASSGRDLATAPMALCHLTRNEGLEEADRVEVPPFCSA